MPTERRRARHPDTRRTPADSRAGSRAGRYERCERPACTRCPQREHPDAPPQARSQWLTRSASRSRRGRDIRKLPTCMTSPARFGRPVRQAARRSGQNASDSPASAALALARLRRNAALARRLVSGSRSSIHSMHQRQLLKSLTLALPCPRSQMTKGSSPAAKCNCAPA